MRLLEGRQRPGLRAQPRVVALGPRLLRRGEAPAMAKEEFREAMPRAEQVGADVFATPQQVACRFFLLGRNVDGGQRAGAIEHRELAGIAPIGFDAVARAGGESSAGAITSHGIRCAVRARCSSKPHGPAS